MTISFSGLASGLDTSSWIESLVALKQAKVTTLQEERENVLLSKDTLNSIKSFFSSFRSTIEKITDSKFHIASMDLFAQNIATSANLEVLTATATTDADEGVYNVRVDKLASNTNAISDYRYLTTIIETTTATLDSKLKDIGVRAGNIGVTNNGVTYSVNISDNDTIGSFIEKLKDIGVEASYNNSTGVFSVNLSKNAIIDTDNTNIVNALHIEGVNEGYTSNRLQIEKVETVYSVANENSYLNELSSGVKITGTQNVTVQNTSGDNYTIEVDAFTKLGEFLEALQTAGLNAEVKNGIVEISGGKITGGTYDALKALGLTDDPYTSQVKGNALTETIVEYEIVTYDTRLVDDLGVSEGYLEVIDSEGNNQYLKIYSGQTIGDLMSDLANMGIYSTLDEDNGILSITGGDFNTLTDADVNALIANGTIRETNDRYKHGTDLLTALYGAPSISAYQTAVSQTYATSQALNKSVTKTISATEATRLDELGITTNETITLHKEDGSTVSFDVTGSTTLGDLLTRVNNNGVTAKLEDGVIYLDGGWMENATVEDALGLEHSTASSYVLGCARTVTKTHDADSDTKLSELGLGDSVITVKGQDDVVLGTVTTNIDMTIGEILTALAGYGISGTIKNGVIHLDSDTGAYVTGGVMDSFGVGTSTTTFTTSVGVINTSSALVAATYTVTATTDTTLSSLGLGLSTVSIKTTDGATVGTITTQADMTIGDFLTALAGYEISGTMKDGVITLKSDDGKYIEGGIATSLGIGTTNSTYTTTSGTSATSSGVLSYNTTTYTTTYPTLTRTLITTSTIVTTDPVIGTQTVTVRDTITVTEPVIGTKTVTVNHTHTETVAQIGSKTVTVSDTVTVPVASIGSQTIIVTHTHTCTEAQIGYQTIRITSTVISTETDTQLTTISGSYTTNVVSNYTQTITISMSSTVTVTTTSSTTLGLAWTSSEPITVSKITTQTTRVTTTVGGTGSTGGVSAQTTIYTAFGTDATCSLTLMVNGTGVTVVCTASDTIDTFQNKMNEAVALVGGYSQIAAWTYDTTKGLYWADPSTVDQVYIMPTGLSTGETMVLSWGTVKFVWNSGYNYIEALKFELDESSSDSSSTKGTSYVSPTRSHYSLNNSYGTITDLTTVNQIVDTDGLNTQYDIFTFSSSTTNKYITIMYNDTIAVIDRKLKIAGVGELKVSDGFIRLTLYDNYTNLDNAFIESSLVLNLNLGYGISDTDGVATLLSTPLSDCVGWSDNPDLTLVVGSTTFDISGTYDVTTFSSVQTLVNIIQNDINSVYSNYTVSYDSTIGALIISEKSRQPSSVTVSSNELSDSLYHNGDGTSVLWFLKAAQSSSGGSTTVTTITTTVTTKTLLTSSDLIGEVCTTLDGVEGQFKALYNQSSFELKIYSTDGGSLVNTVTLYPNATIDDLNGSLASFGYGSASVTNGVVTITPASGYYFDWEPNIKTSTGSSVDSDPLKLESKGYTVTEGSTEIIYTVISAGTQTVSGSQTTTVTWSYSTVVEEVTGTRNVTNLVVATITVENTTTKTVTHLSTTTHVVEKTSTAPQTYTVSDTFVVDTVTYKTVTHTTSSTHTVENTTTKQSTYTIEQTFTIEKTTTKPVTITVYGTAVYSTTSVTVATTTTSYTADESSKFSQLGMSSDGTITVNSGGTQYVVTVNSNDTIGDMIASLAGLGIYGSMQGGKVTFKGDSDAYITGFSSNITTALKVAGGSGNTYSTSTHTTKANTTSSEQKYNTTNTLSTDDTLGLHGLTADGTITVVSDGTQHVVTVHAGDTIDDMLTSLAGLGIYGYVNGGKLSLQGDEQAFIKGISNNLKTALKLGETNFVTEDHTVTKNTDSNHLTHNVTTLMSDSTLLTDLGITNGNFKITEQGVEYTYNLDTGAIKTIGDFRNLLSNYGFTSYVDEQGRLVIKDDSDSYLTSVTGGSNILTQLDIDDWTFGKMTQQSSWLTDTTIVDDGRVNGDTLMTELRDSSGNLLGISTGEFVVVSNGVRTVETINADTTVDDFKSTLASYGMVMNLATDGSITVGAQHNSYLATSASAGVNTNAIDVLFSEWNFVNVYTSNNIEIPEDVVVSMTRDTKLADINEGTYVDGCITVVHDGIQTNLSLTADDTVGTLMDELALYGFECVINNSGQLIIKSDGNATLQAYTGADKASNLLTLLRINSANWVQTNSYKNEQIQTSEVVTSHLDATYDTKLSDLDLTWDNNALKAGGVIGLTVDGMSYKINIDADETFGTLKDKFAALGLEATISDGVLMIQSGYKDMVIDTANTTSNIVGDFGLTFHNDLGGYSASNDEVEQTISWTEDVVLSVSNYADYDTKMSLLNITSGTLSVFRDGQRATVNVNSDETFGQLRSRIATAFADVDIKFENGYLKFYSNTGASVEVGSTTDTSNISAICGFVNDKTGTVKSARELYRVNGDSKITTAGLFRRGNVTTGTFTVGDAVFTIDENTTLQNIISQINASESANATATWDSVDGKLVIKSRTTGSSFINIEAGTSNFTDIMGYTKTEVNATNGAVIAKRLDVNTQDVGNNAVFTINGTTYTSTSNTIASDVSRITGVTINLKGVSEGEEVKVTVEKDKETVANAVSDIVDAYNELIENVDKEIAKGSALDDQSTLKFIRNQIRSLMTSSISGAGVFRNLDSVGISLDAATAGSISTSTINVLNFDKDKFLKAFDADRDALKDLLVGTDTSKGVFQQVETVVESALASNYGYFASAEKSYSSEISKLDNKIKKAQESVARYRERLEAKFASMDLLIANIQNQYSSFLG